MTTETDFVGTTIAFPLGVDATGAIAMVSGQEAIERSLTMILSTAPGERVMRPDFGCAIWNLLFDPVNDNSLGLMAQSVRQAVAQWEPRIEVAAVTARPTDADHSVVEIDIEYLVKATNDRRNLVYPFYTIPGEGP